MWWVGAGLAAWAVTAAAGVALGRALHHAGRLDRTYLDDPTAPPPGYLTNDHMEPSLAGAILALGYTTDEPSARYWLDVCAQRGADWTLQRQLWDAWQSQHARDTTRLHTDDDQET